MKTSRMMLRQPLRRFYRPYLDPADSTHKQSQAALLNRLCRRVSDRLEELPTF